MRYKAIVGRGIENSILKMLKKRHQLVAVFEKPNGLKLYILAK